MSLLPGTLRKARSWRQTCQPTPFPGENGTTLGSHSHSGFPPWSPSNRSGLPPFTTYLGADHNCSSYREFRRMSHLTKRAIRCCPKSHSTVVRGSCMAFPWTLSTLATPCVLFFRARSYLCIRLGQKVGCGSTKLASQFPASPPKRKAGEGSQADIGIDIWTSLSNLFRKPGCWGCRRQETPPMTPKHNVRHPLPTNS